MDLSSPRLRYSQKRSKEIDERILEEIRFAGEYEFYFGVKETPEFSKMFTINRPLFYAVYQKEDDALIGYVGLHDTMDYYEPEIYIFKKSRGQGYGTEALRALLGAAWRGIIKLNNKADASGASCIEATVRKENLASQRMLEKVGFQQGYIGFGMSAEEESDDFISILGYVLHKEDLTDL